MSVQDRVTGGKKMPSTALALMAGEAGKMFKKAILKASRIENRELEETRRHLQHDLFEMRAVFERIRALGSFNPEAFKDWPYSKIVEWFEKAFRRPPPIEDEDRKKLIATVLEIAQDEREKLITYYQLLSTYCIANGIVHLSDYLCVQFPRTVTEVNEKTGERKKRKEMVRFTLGDLLNMEVDLVEGYEDKDDHRNDEPGVLGRLDTLVQMVNDLGCRQEAWKDENNLHDPSKYLDRGPSNRVKADAVAPDAEEEPEVAPSEISDEKLEKAKRGEFEVPDLRPGKRGKQNGERA